MVDFFTKNNIKGIIFDCDGVLVDSEKLSCGALNVVFEKHFNIDIGTDYSNIIGNALADSFFYYFNKFNLELLSNSEMQQLYLEKDLAYQNLARGTIKSFPGVIFLIEEIEKLHLYKAVASSGTHNKINFNLTESNLKKYFSVISSADEVEKGKPHPDLFLLTAQKMFLEPQQCAVIEDSLSGIKGAKAANMYAIGVSNTFDKESLLSVGADIVVSRLDELLKS